MFGTGAFWSRVFGSSAIGLRVFGLRLNRTLKNNIDLDIECLEQERLYQECFDQE